MNIEVIKNKVREIYLLSGLDVPDIEVVDSVKAFEVARSPFMSEMVHAFFQKKKHSGVWETIKQTMMHDVVFNPFLHTEHTLSKYESEDWKELWSFKDRGGLVYKIRSEEIPNGGRIIYEWESSSRFTLILDAAEDKKKAEHWRSLISDFSFCFFLKEKAIVLVDNSI